MAIGFLETVGSWASIIVPLMGGILWLAKRSDRSTERLSKQINKIDKHKVSYKECDKRRADGLCRPVSPIEKR
jgi:hypothetical protein